MTHRPHPKYASNDARQGPWANCSDCGFNWSLSSLQFQYDFRGGSTPMNMGWLRCPRCISPLTYQRKLLIIPPDPPPIFNTMPENYPVDEAGPTQDLAVVIILNSNINASLSQTTDAYFVLLWGAEELMWNPEFLVWGIPSQEMDWGTEQLFWGGLELFWGN